jgi:peptidyl-prolyl cis-trans isomerase SurA
MKWVRFVALMALGLVLPGVPASAQQQILNGVAAVVNDKVITKDNVEQFSLRALQAAARQTRTQEAFEQKQIEIFRDSLEILIERELILREFETAGYNLPETIIEDYVNQQVREEFGDRISLVKSLHQRNQTFEDYRKDIRDTFVITTMTRKNVTQTLVISPKRIEKFYQDNLSRYQVGDRAKVRVIVVEKARHARGEPLRIATEASRRARAS